MELLEIKNLSKCFYTPTGAVVAKLFIPSLSLKQGQQLVLEGASGSGKTTLLHLISGLLAPDSGSISFDGVQLTTMSQAERDKWRGRNLGYIFQRLNLLDMLTVEENILLAANWSGKNPACAGKLRERCHSLLEAVGLADKSRLLPGRLSLGEQQRVAVARALLLRPKLLLADEPTASLDTHNAKLVLGLLEELCQKNQVTLIISTHDEAIKSRFKNRYDVRRNAYVK